MNIETYTVPRFYSNFKFTVVKVDGKPICVEKPDEARNIVLKLQGYDVPIKDEKIDRLICRIKAQGGISTRF